jgi:hypothetical protein
MPDGTQRNTKASSTVYGLAQLVSYSKHSRRLR